MKRMFIAVSLGIVLALIFVVAVVLNQTKNGRVPTGKRMERIKQSPNYRNGEFQNQNEAHQSIKEVLRSTKTKVQSRPLQPLSVIKTDLKIVDCSENFIVWFGHSSYFIQVDGVKILVDPVFCDASPFSFINQPFSYTQNYTPEEIPSIDFLVITHDHWDHLDYETVTRIQHRTANVICPLGVGEHFEYWGFDTSKITELDWYEVVDFERIKITCRPAMHFSGRMLKRNQSLWASFVLQTDRRTFYVGGDSGYGTHFAEVGRDFDLDYAFVENGQYNEAWSGIHTMPKYLDSIVADLHAKYIITVHHSKYALSRHSWDEPLCNAQKLRQQYGNVLIPAIGEKIIIE